MWRIAGRIGDLKRRLLSKSHAQDGTVCVAAKRSSVCDWARPFDQEHCEHANPRYLRAQCGGFKLRRNAKRRFNGATLDFVAIGQLHR
jgi:hypothetical protein